MLAEIIWNAGTITMAGAYAVAVVAVAGGLWYAVERTTSVNRLKQRMVERGMSAEDVERVMAAGMPRKE